MLFAKDTILIKVHHKKATRQTYLLFFFNEISDHYSRERAFIDVLHLQGLLYHHLLLLHMLQ